MGINEILEQQGWELKQQQDWISVWDHRPELSKISRSGRVAKLIGPNLYVVPALLTAITEALILDAKALPKQIKSTNGANSAVYLGFDTSTVSDEDLETFVTKLRAAINNLL